MAPAVPFALVGVVQITAVAGWLGLAGAVSFPRLRRRVFWTLHAKPAIFARLLALHVGAPLVWRVRMAA